jgi:hypothetical protein
MSKNTNEYWEKLLKLRYERLGKFIQLKGPMSIIVVECRLIQEAYYKGFWKAIFKTILQRYRSKWRLWRMRLTESDKSIIEAAVNNSRDTPYSSSESHKPL